MSINNLQNIVHLSKYYPPFRGGIESHVQTLARNQAQLGYRVYVICINTFDKVGNLTPRSPSVQELDQGVRVIRVGRLVTLARFDFCIGIAGQLRRLLSKSNTIVHLHTPNPTMLFALVRVLQPMNLIVTHHSDIIKQRMLKYLLRPMELVVYGRSKKILTTSAQYLEGSKFLELYPQKVDYLPLSLDIAPFANPAPESIKFAKVLREKYGSPLWLCVGRLVYYKALHIAIRALPAVPGKLVIIGVGSLQKSLMALAEELEVGERIIWLGSVSDVELVGAYHASTALWFPSNVRSEGFGVVQIEAMASGCPVINTNIIGSGVPWVCRHEQESLTVPINDPVALAEAANRLLHEPGLRERLVEAGRKRAKHFDSLTLARRSLEFYEQVLGSSLPIKLPTPT